MIKLTLIKRGELVHVTNNGLDSSRLSFSEFMSVIRHLKKHHRHDLNRDLYNGQPVYEFRDTTDNIMTTIAEKVPFAEFRVSSI